MGCALGTSSFVGGAPGTSSFVGGAMAMGQTGGEFLLRPGLAALGAATLRTRHLLGEADDLGIGCEPSSPGGGLLYGQPQPALAADLAAALACAAAAAARRCTSRCSSAASAAACRRVSRCSSSPPDLMRSELAKREGRDAQQLPPCRRFGREEHLPVDGVDVGPQHARESRQCVVLALERVNAVSGSSTLERLQR
jgi:hypothetical protein